MKVYPIPEENKISEGKEKSDRKGKRVYDYIFHKDKIYMITKSVEENDQKLELHLRMQEFIVGNDDNSKTTHPNQTVFGLGKEIFNEVLVSVELKDQNLVLDAISKSYL